MSQIIAEQWIPVASLRPSPNNPRLFMREERIERIAGQMREAGYDPKFPILVRPLGDVFEVIDGHHRLSAVTAAGLPAALAKVVELDDVEALEAQFPSNDQDGWLPLEIGIGFLRLEEASTVGAGRGNSGGIRGFAKRRGISNTYAQECINAARAYLYCREKMTGQPVIFADKTQHLAAIHALPQSCWPAAVQIMLDRQWSVKDTKHWVDLAREFVIPDKWQSIFLPFADVVARFLETREFSAQTVKRLINEAERVELMLLDNKQPTDEWFAWLAENKGADAWDVRLVSQRGRELENEIEDANKDVVAWHLGNWRDHVDALEDGSVSAIVTDPPYGVDFQSDHRLDRRKEHKHDRIENDGDLQAAADEMQSAFSALAPKLKADASVFVFCSWKNEFETRAAVEAAGFLVRNSIVWVKNRTGMGDPNTTFAPKHERIIFAVKGSPILSERLPDVLEADRPDSSRHPTEKPTDLLSQLIGVTTVQGDLVADPFGGVASTVVAAVESGRRGWGCEISAEYHDAGKDRL